MDHILFEIKFGLDCNQYPKGTPIFLYWQACPESGTKSKTIELFVCLLVRYSRNTAHFLGHQERMRIVRSKGVIRRSRRRSSLAAWSSRSWNDVGILPPKLTSPSLWKKRSMTVYSLSPQWVSQVGSVADYRLTIQWSCLKGERNNLAGRQRNSTEVVGQHCSILHVLTTTNWPEQHKIAKFKIFYTKKTGFEIPSKKVQLWNSKPFNVRGSNLKDLRVRDTRRREKKSGWTTAQRLVVWSTARIWSIFGYACTYKELVRYILQLQIFKLCHSRWKLRDLRINVRGVIQYLCPRMPRKFGYIYRSHIHRT